MSMTDPIADLFTRIRNAGIASHNKVDMPHSKLKEEIARLMVRCGYLREVQVTEVDGRRRMRAYLKLDEDGKTIIQRIERMTKPGCRKYLSNRDVPRVLRGLGIGIYSTSKGVLSDSECRERRVGGEYLGRIW